MKAENGKAVTVVVGDATGEANRVRPWAPLAAMAVVLLVAYGLDRWLESARNVAAAFVSVDTYQWVILVGNLAFAACVLACSWAWLRSGPSRAAATVFLIVGLAIILLPTPPFWSFGTQVPSRLVPVLQASPHSLFGQAGAFLAVLGVAGLAWPQAHR